VLAVVVAVVRDIQNSQDNLFPGQSHINVVLPVLLVLLVVMAGLAAQPHGTLGLLQRGVAVVDKHQQLLHQLAALLVLALHSMVVQVVLAQQALAGLMPMLVAVAVVRVGLMGPEEMAGAVLGLQPKQT
jgi:hypothetical protein